MSAIALLVAVLLAPDTALACATCVWSAFGDRSYNWAFLGLILLPFAVVAVVGGLIVREVRRARSSDDAPLPEPDVDPAHAPWPHPPIEERT